jgi:uncharacterized protein (TIGR03435 family)
MTKGAARMTGIANFMESMMGLGAGRGQPVVDKTNLTGIYDIIFRFDMTAPLGGGRGEGGSRQPAEFDPPLPKALEDQLGLRLERAKVPFEYIIVDHIEKPSEN